MVHRFRVISIEYAFTRRTEDLKKRKKHFLRRSITERKFAPLWVVVKITADKRLSASR